MDQLSQAKYLSSLAKRLPSIMAKKKSSDLAPGFRPDQISALSSSLENFSEKLYDAQQTVVDDAKCHRAAVSVKAIDEWLDKSARHRELFNRHIYGRTKDSGGLDKGSIEASDAAYAYRYFTQFVNAEWLGVALTNELTPHLDDICNLLRPPSAARPVKVMYCDKHGLQHCQCDGGRSVVWKCFNTSDLRQCRLCHLHASQTTFVASRTKCRKAYICPEHTSDEILSRSTACCEQLRLLEWNCSKHPSKMEDDTFCCVKARATNMPPLALADIDAEQINADPMVNADEANNDEVVNVDGVIIDAGALPEAALDDDVVLAEVEQIGAKLRAEATKMDADAKIKRRELESFRKRIAETIRGMTKFILCHLGDVEERVEALLPFVSHIDSRIAYRWLEDVMTDLIRAHTIQHVSLKRRRLSGS
eukprot:GEMP01046092.1.p1 GENE.GEMP01046092.1~~GEMP01046092.1.p1  ORF type:complete len:420 (+),score=115.03 GEMP01046092.1:47-1306(+)